MRYAPGLRREVVDLLKAGHMVASTRSRSAVAVTKLRRPYHHDLTSARVAIISAARSDPHGRNLYPSFTPRKLGEAATTVDKGSADGECVLAGQSDDLTSSDRSFTRVAR